MNHKSWIEERKIIQWPNEPEATSRRKTENTKVKWTASHEQKKQIMQWPNKPQATSRRKTENAMAKWTTSHE